MKGAKRHNAAHLIILSVLIFCSAIFAENAENGESGDNTRWIVESIRFRRIFPLFNSDVEPSLGFRRGSFVNREIIERGVESVKKTMEARGLRNIELRFETEINPENESVIITIIKEHSERSRITEINFEGNRRFSDRQLNRSLSAWKYRNSLLDEIEFSNDLRNLKIRYFDRSFADVVVRDSILPQNDMDAEILITIDEGKKYKLKIADRGVLRRRFIKNEFDFTSGRSNRNDRIIRTARRNIENKLLSMGYSDGKVEVSDTIIAGRRRDVRKISVKIQAGERISLDSIEFTGNEFFSAEQLLNTMKSTTARNGRIRRNGRGSFLPRAINNDAILLENKYFKSGFLNVDVEAKSEVSEHSAVVRVQISEGVQTIVNSINFNELCFDTIQIPLKINTALNPFAVDTSVRIFRNILSESGFVNARVGQRVEFNADSSLAEIYFDIEKGERFVFGEVSFVGNFKTKERYINRFLDIEKGSDFSNRILAQNMRNLRRINAFRSVSSEVIPSSDSVGGNTNNIMVSFDEIYPFVFTFSGGFNTEVLFYSNFKFTNRNFLGLNKIFSAGTGISAKERFVELNFIEPYFFNEKLSLGIDLYYRNNEIVDKKFWSHVGGNNYGISFRPNNVFSTNINANYEIRRLYPFRNFDFSEYESNDSIDVSLVNKTRHILSTTPSAAIDFRDSKIRPRKGGLLSSQVLVSHGINSIQDDFIKAEAEARFFVPMSRFFTLALRSGVGKATPYGRNDRVAMDGLFSVGGASTVRGFQEGKLWTYDGDFPVLAYSKFFNSAELRASLGAFEIPFFVDFGTITDRNGGEFRPMKYSLGTGLRYITPIGPIGIVFGIPLDNKSRKENTDSNLFIPDAALHFSIGYSF